MQARRIHQVLPRQLTKPFVTDVDEVAREIFEETIGGSTQVQMQYALNDGSGVSVQPNPLASGTPGEYSRAPHELLAVLNAEHVAERLARLESSLIQLERINGATLQLLQQIFAQQSPVTIHHNKNENSDA